MTFLAASREFLRHDMPGHPEGTPRLQRLLDHVQRVPFLRDLDRLEPDRPATDDELLAVHTRRVLLAVAGAEQQPPAWIDPDTYIVPGSERAARLAARLTLQAATRAMENDEAGMVLVRPPGHHATRDRSMGFCLYNNVAIAAENLLRKGLAKRILVFDHDVHHGNGTQDIFWERDRVLYQSFHLAPHYPGTGAVTETGTGPGLGFTMNAPLSMGDGEPEVRSLLEEAFLPAARAYRPDLVLVSAGFDSLEGDPLGGLRLAPAFFGEIAARLLTVCPRVVSVLEGGYQVDEIPKAVEAETRALDGESFPMDGPVSEPTCLPALRDAVSEHWPNLALRQ